VGKKEDNAEGETVSLGGGINNKLWMMIYLELRLFA